MPTVLFFSSRQISAHPIRNFRANSSTQGRFDNIEDILDNLNAFEFHVLDISILCKTRKQS